MSRGIDSVGIVIPKKWADQYSLKKGDEIDLDIVGEKIVIGADSKLIKSVTVDITQFNSSLIYRQIFALYCAGYDVLILKFENKTVEDFRSKKMMKPQELIGLIVDGLIGFEISEEKKNQVVIKELSSVKKEEFFPHFRKLFFQVQQLATDCKNALISGNKEELETISRQDRRLNRFALYCIRILNKAGAKQPYHTAVFYSIIQSLEYMGDEISKLSQMGRLSKENMQLFELMIQGFDVYTKLFFEHDQKYFSEFYVIRRKFQSQWNDKLNLHLYTLMDTMTTLLDRKMELV